MEPKVWYKSRLFWLGVLGVVGVGLDAYVSGADWKHALCAAASAIVVWLRAGTSQPLSLKKPEAQQ